MIMKKIQTSGITLLPLHLKNTIGFSSIRGGSIVGEHSVIFAGDSEVITLSHSALSRKIFVKGAMLAARWSLGKDPGYYSMDDVLNIEK